MKQMMTMTIAFRQPYIAPYKGIQDQHSLGFWIASHAFRIPGTGFRSLSVEILSLVGFRIS